MLGRLVERPMSWLPAGHHAIVAGEKTRAEEGDDRRGRAVSEREREQASARGRAALLGRLGLLGRVSERASERGRARARGWAARSWAEPKEERRSGPSGSFCFSFSKI
jgi:hypothetical protein